jgi:hypothetical protein
MEPVYPEGIAIVAEKALRAPQPTPQVLERRECPSSNDYLTNLNILGNG